MITLDGGKLTDAKGRTGYIAANHQFQFDSPPQTGAIYTSGWSACSNGSLAIGNNAVFYQCLSGNFYNLYDQSSGDQCSPVYIDVIKTGSSGVASAIPDGQVTASAVVSQQTDGQPTGASAAAPVTQISDGQIQASTAAAPITQISDGQIQVPTSTAAAAPVTQISDGQIQVPTSTAVAPVTQISDGQIQVPTSTAVSPVTQISDGQIQAPTSVVSPVTQISDGQIQAPTATGTGYLSSNGTMATASPSPYTGGASGYQASFGLGAGVVALAMLL